MPYLAQPKDRFKWHDQEWMEKRRRLGETDQMRRQPMAIYEVHLPSWMRGSDGQYLSKSTFPHVFRDHYLQFPVVDNHWELHPIERYDMEWTRYCMLWQVTENLQIDLFLTSRI